MPYTQLCQLRPGILIAHNSFLSTSSDPDIADMFASVGAFYQTSERVSVLYHIVVDNRYLSR